MSQKTGDFLKKNCLFPNAPEIPLKGQTHVSGHVTGAGKSSND